MKDAAAECSDDPLVELQAWFEEQCDADWEHSYGVKLATLDNPGWDFSVDLVGTKLAGKQFEEVRSKRSEVDWLHCRRDGDVFVAFGGARNLKEMISIFIRWAREATPR